LGHLSNIENTTVPGIIYQFFLSKYVANYLGFYVPNFYDIREFILDNLDEVEPGFIRIAFADFNENTVNEGFEDRITLEKLNQFLSYLLKHFNKIRQFFEERGEVFCIELHFQLPFIHKSILKSRQKRMLFIKKKIRFYNTYRQNLRGIFLVTQKDEDVSPFLPNHHLLLKLPSNLENFNFFLAYPSQLKDYWELVLQETKLSF